MYPKLLKVATKWKSHLTNFPPVQKWALNLNYGNSNKYFSESEWWKFQENLKFENAVPLQLMDIILYMSLHKQMQQACKILLGSEMVT
jgi:hypothetical protein